MQFEQKCIKIGASVYLILFEIRGIVTEIILEQRSVKYMVSYNNRGNHAVDVFREVELEWDKEDEVSIWAISKEPD